ncbi:MAG: chromosomal replication initiator protein DnaA [Legionellales bacterium]|nr:chromosomal replication initiator protein DnaA [Legionellales bacterium]
MSIDALWQDCLEDIREEIDEQDYMLWFLPLQAVVSSDALTLYAPNVHVKDHVVSQFAATIDRILSRRSPAHALKITSGAPVKPSAPDQPAVPVQPDEEKSFSLSPSFTIENFVPGKSNELAVAAVKQIVERPGVSYNPLFIIGDSGLGKTHLMQAAGHAISKQLPNVIYVPSERFVAEMVKALQCGEIDAFKSKYRNADALLIDDVQFFSKKLRTQEEFFHAFNALTESGKQVILTSDKFPQELEGLEGRLKTRFSYGLTVSIDPPDLETRVAILKTKSEQAALDLPEDVAFFIASNIQSNVRELEGALRKVMANAHFLQATIDVPFAKEALRELISMQQRLVTIDKIQRTIASHFNIKVSDIKSKKRARGIARPRQMSMYLSKELSNKSLMEIGEYHGGRDHTTVIHACRQVEKLLQDNSEFYEDYHIVKRLLG